MKTPLATALILATATLAGCHAGGSEGTASAWECTAFAENNLGADRLYSWHDVNKVIAAQNALQSCKLHDNNPEMCRVVLGQCEPF